jgi:hypothetical protein
MIKDKKFNSGDINPGQFFRDISLLLTRSMWKKIPASLQIYALPFTASLLKR